MKKKKDEKANTKLFDSSFRLNLHLMIFRWGGERISNQIIVKRKTITIFRIRSICQAFFAFQWKFFCLVFFFLLLKYVENPVVMNSLVFATRERKEVRDGASERNHMNNHHLFKWKI